MLSAHSQCQGQCPAFDCQKRTDLEQSINPRQAEKFGGELALFSSSSCVGSAFRPVSALVGLEARSVPGPQISGHCHRCDGATVAPPAFCHKIRLQHRALTGSGVNAAILSLMVVRSPWASLLLPQSHAMHPIGPCIQRNDTVQFAAPTPSPCHSLKLLPVLVRCLGITNPARVMLILRQLSRFR